MRPIAAVAEQVRAARRPAAPDNIFINWQEQVSDTIVATLDSWRDMRDRAYEKINSGIYGSPIVQAAVGERASAEPPRHRHPQEPMHRALIERQIAQLRARMRQGGIREAAIRALLYLAGADLAADERMFAVLQQIRAEHGYDIPLSELKAIIREQFFMLLVDEDEAVATIRDLARREPARDPGSGRGAEPGRHRDRCCPGRAGQPLLPRGAAARGGGDRLIVDPPGRPGLQCPRGKRRKPARRSAARAG